MRKLWRGILMSLFFWSAALTAADLKPKPGVDPGPSIMAATLRSTDLERSIKYYESVLGMVVTGRLLNGAVTEVFLAFKGRENQPGLVLYRDATPGKSPALDHGNAGSRVLLRMPDVTAIAARLKNAGYGVGQVHVNGNVKVLMIEDPDENSFELAQLPEGDVQVKGSMQ
jgi:catechol 2,3-dioxygenase-like lactoylglutathione lyase family enzyme